MRALVAVIPIALAACGSTTTPAHPVDNRAHAAAPECPPDENLVERARAAWALDPAEPIDVTACAPGHFGEDGWLVEAFVRAGGENADLIYEQWQSILGSASFDRVIVRGSASEVPPWYVEMGGGTWSAHDLDGDGIDELLDVTSYDHHGYVVENLSVFRVAAGQLERVGTLALSYDNTSAADDEASTINCSAIHAVEPAAAAKHIVVTGTHAGARDGAEQNCPKTGAHRYGLVGGKLAEL
jgi:hypothetical protein